MKRNGEECTEVYSGTSNLHGSVQVKRSTTKALDKNGEGWLILYEVCATVCRECPNSVSFG